MTLANAIHHLGAALDHLHFAIATNDDDSRLSLVRAAVDFMTLAEKELSE